MKSIEYDAGFKGNESCVGWDKRNRKLLMEMMTNSDSKSLEEIRDDLRLLSDFGFTHIKISGEISKRVDFLDVLESAREFDVLLETDGSAFSDDSLIDSCNRFKIKYNVVLYSCLSEEDSHNHPVDGLVNLAKRGCNIQVTVPITMTNYKRLSSILSTLLRLGISEVDFKFQEVIGDPVAQDYLPQYQRIEHHIEDLYRKSLNLPNVKIFNIPLCFFHERDIIRLKSKVIHNSGKHTNKCEGCVLKNDCPGVNESYLKQYGDGGVFPVR